MGNKSQKIEFEIRNPNGISIQRMKSLVKGYKSPELLEFISEEPPIGDCSDMASAPYNCCNNVGCRVTVCVGKGCSCV